MSRLNLESLGDRSLPSSVGQVGTVLTVLGDSNQPNVVTVDPGSEAGSVWLTVNGKGKEYTGVTDVLVVGGRKADDISNNTAVNLTASGGAGDDTIFGGLGRNMILPGAGRDVTYTLLGTNTIVSTGDNEADRVFVGAGAKVVSDDKDSVVTFFGEGRVPGSGRVELADGVLYITPTNAGTTTQIDEVGDLVVVSFDFGSGTQVEMFNKADVRSISYFGGTGDDVYLNNTDLDEAAYGSAGNDIMVGGTGRYSLMKGSSGDDVLVGRAARNDLSGNGGVDWLFVGPKQNTLRVDAADLIVGRLGKDDLVVRS